MKRGICTALVCALLVSSWALYAETLKSKLGFYIEMPAGFLDMKTGDNATRFAFTDPNGVMEFDLIAYDKGRFTNVEDLAAKSIALLKSSGESSVYSYQDRRAALATLDFQLDSVPMLGFAVFIQGRNSERDYALLAYVASELFDDYADFILSCLDSFSIDAAALRMPGPISQFTLAWPPERGEQRSVILPDGLTADLPWSEAEGRQEHETCMREYKVLSAYADEPELWQDAWIRFYRMVYRESAARLDRLALEVTKAMPPDDPTEQTRRILAWVQKWNYERDPEGMDFVPPLTAAYEGRGDCDSRALTAAIILERLGIDAVIMVSREYSHALLGVDVPGGGQRYSFAGKNFLVGETTAGVGLGMIAADQADFSKWIGIQVGR